MIICEFGKLLRFGIYSKENNKKETNSNCLHRPLGVAKQVPIPNGL